MSTSTRPPQPPLGRVAATTKRRRESGLGSDEVDRLYAWGGVALVGALVAVLGFMLDIANIDVWTAVLTAVVLVALSVPLFRWISSADNWPRLHRWLLAGLVLKLLVSLVRYWFIFRLNGGNGDAGVYIEAAGEFAQRLRLGLPLHPLGRIANFPKESQYIGDVTGVVFYVTGASRYAAFFVFSWACYLGQVLSVRALRVAVPEADHHRYMLAMLFLPSLLFWPSSVGKEAVMIFSLGFISYGAGLLLAPRPRLRGTLYFAAGFGAVVLVRPHIALMALVSLVGALSVAFVAGRGGATPGRVAPRGRRRPGARRQRESQGRVVRLLAILGLVVVTVLALGQLSSTLDGGRDGRESTAQEQLTKAARQTSIGDSAFRPVQATSVVDLPAAVGTVVFRPFLWEGGAGGALAAIESTLLLVLTLVSLPRLRTFPTLALRRTYLLFSTAFVVVFAFGFSYIGNFGILARQRVQMFPALLVLMALPTRAALAERWRREDPESPGDRQGELPEADLAGRVGTLTAPRSALRRVGSRAQP